MGEQESKVDLNLMTRSKVSRFANSITARLPSEILSNIFLKLPVKSILGCRCVCKSWRQLLCDPQFIKLHANRINQHPSCAKLLIKTFCNFFYSVDIEASHVNAVSRNFPIKGRPYTQIMGSCNGLLCIAVPHKKQPIRYRTLLEVVLWNPSTGDYKTLPSAEPPVNHVHMVAFGYESSFEDYKMLRLIIPNVADFEYRVDMYSLKTNSWKIIRDLPNYHIFNYKNDCGVCVNGSIYWVGSCNLVGFDLKHEKFRELPWPFDMQQGYYSGSYKGLLVMRGDLGMHYIGPQGELVVWELKEGDDDKKEEWIKLMTISSEWVDWRDRCQRFGRHKALGPFYLLENGKVDLHKKDLISKRTSKEENIYEVLVFVPSVLMRFPVYNPKRISSMPEFIHIHGLDASNEDWVTYTESLVSPNFYT